MVVKRSLGPLNYKNSGVDVNAGYEAVELMKQHTARTLRPEVIGGLGSFGGLFAPNLTGMSEPVLVSGTDGVGTKLKVAFLMDRHDTVGIDCVAMCVNDIICQGAEPLFFLDYIATGKLDPAKAAEIVKGIADGCVQSGCALIGGETAEMPGFYPHGEYDMAGFSVGVVDKQKMIDGSQVKCGDIIIGLPASGVHSNGFSLVRKLFFQKLSVSVQHYYDELANTLGNTLLTPTKIYVKPVLAVLRNHTVNGIAHITGGGFYENIPRAYADKTLNARIERSSYIMLPIFSLIQKLGNISEKNMYNTFNMGIGMIMIVDKSSVDSVLETLRLNGERPVVIGEMVDGCGEVEFA
ncbi:MAG: phosphoribosylformylglycinamidine cyclo-ligase [Negativicutes bacterium]|jgi:phosphoribosylformylglycinamidine cyclo-ligase